MPIIVLGAAKVASATVLGIGGAYLFIKDYRANHKKKDK